MISMFIFIYFSFIVFHGSLNSISDKFKITQNMITKLNIFKVKIVSNDQEIAQPERISHSKEGRNYMNWQSGTNTKKHIDI